MHAAYVSSFRPCGVWNGVWNVSTDTLAGVQLAEAPRARALEMAECRLAASLMVAAYFVISFCTLGLQYAQSLLFTEWLDYFNTSRAVASSVGTLGTGVMEGSGVISGYLITRFGERRCCIIGGALAAIGLLIGSFAVGFSPHFSLHETIISRDYIVP